MARRGNGGELGRGSEFVGQSSVIVNVTLFLCFALLSFGCAAKRSDYLLPPVALPDSFSNLPDVSLSHAPGASLPALDDDILVEWWRLFTNQELDVLIDRVLANNHDLKIASLRIAQAQARLDVTGSGLWPEITLPAQAKIDAPENGIGSVRPGGKPHSQRTYQASIRADWRPDIWGERTALYESAEMQLWRAVFQRDDAQRRLIAEATSNYLEYLTLNDRLRVADETEKVLSEMLASLQARLESGDATITEMEQQKAAVFSVRATIPVLQHQKELVLNRLASLAGVVPGGLRLSADGLDSLKFHEGLPGVPSSLLLRRPDIRVVEARLVAADADIDVARARVLPSLDLTAQVGYGSHFVSQLFQPHTLFWNAIANLSATIFDHGKRSHEVEFAATVHEELVEDYVKTVYQAVREVEDAISAVNLFGRRVKAQQEATGYSLSAWRHSQESYLAGAVDYLVLLDTERTYHRNLDAWYTARQERYLGLIELFSALGGGVLDERLRSPELGKRLRFAAEQVAGDDAAVGEKAAIEPSVTEPVAREPGIPAPEDKAAAAGLDWSGNRFAATAEAWMIELSGVHEYSTVEAVWRDLRRRFPLQAQGFVLAPRKIGKIVVGKAARSAWYRLYLADFPNRDAALEFLSLLRGQFVSAYLFRWDGSLHLRDQPGRLTEEFGEAVK